ncbi:MAG: NADPH-dependent FMN reductase [Actinomycetes bacterium]
MSTLDNSIAIGVVPLSLRRASANRGLARAAVAHLGPAGELILIDDLPLFSQDHEVADGEPALAEGRRWRESVRGCDALLFCTPEYDAYPPAMAINALNWLSREPEPPLKGKPVAIAGAAAGFRGSRRSQAHLRLILDTIGARTIEQHFYVQIADRFDSEGNLTDPEALEQFGSFLDSVVADLEAR